MSSLVYIFPMYDSTPSGFLAGIISLAVFLLLAIFVYFKCGNYFEESPDNTAKFIKAEFAAIFFVHISLLSDGNMAPKIELLISIGCHCVYALHLLSFPRVSLGSARSIASFVAFVVSHLVWLHHFQSHNGEDLATLVAFYIVMVWLMPFTLAVSVEVSDFELPTMYSACCDAAPINTTLSSGSFSTSVLLDSDTCSPRVGLSSYSKYR
jgi:hypothetical protein